MKFVRKFRPDEVLFSPTAACNLACPHCDPERPGSTLPIKTAERFLEGCLKAGVERVGFTGGEPFLAPKFLTALIRKAVGLGLVFDRIMTNGVWWHDKHSLEKTLSALRDAGYDGTICVSVDAFHRQDLRKIAYLICTSVGVWRRPDIISIAYVTGARSRETVEKLKKLARILGGRLKMTTAGQGYIRADGVFLRISRIDLSPVGKASRLKSPWDGAWFREDHCQGPGNVLFVLPDGSVKPCCGYASGGVRLLMGDIRRDSARDIIKNINKDPFISTIYNSGLVSIRRRLEKEGVDFPGRTTNHCYFCEYILTRIPERTLKRCLDR